MIQLRRIGGFPGLAERMVVVGRLGQGGKIGGLLERELAQLLVEVVERGGRHAVGAHAEIDLVEIELEDLVLGVGALDADGEDRFLELAVELLLARQQEVLGHLLGDGGGAFGAPSCRQFCEIVVDGAADAGEIEPAVLVEALVLGRQERGDDQLRDDVDGHEDAPLARVLGHQAAVVRMDARHDRRLVLGEALVVGQVARGFPDEEPDDRRGRQEQHDARRKTKAEQAQQPAALCAASWARGGGGRIGVGLIATKIRHSVLI